VPRVGRKTRQPRKKALQSAFLGALTQTGGNIVRAAAIVGMDRDLHYHWMDDPAYRARFDAAWEKAIDTLEAEAARRAFDGVEEPIYHAGKRAVDVTMDAKGKPKAVPAAIRKYSDTLLMFLLNGNRSRKYRQRSDQRIVDEEGRDRPNEVRVIVEYADTPKPSE
jgi:hypothetical protein